MLIAGAVCGLGRRCVRAVRVRTHLARHGERVRVQPAVALGDERVEVHTPQAHPTCTTLDGRMPTTGCVHKHARGKEVHQEGLAGTDSAMDEEAAGWRRRRSWWGRRGWQVGDRRISCWRAAGTAVGCRLRPCPSHCGGTQARSPERVTALLLAELVRAAQGRVGRLRCQRHRRRGDRRSGVIGRLLCAAASAGAAARAARAVRPVGLVVGTRVVLTQPRREHHCRCAGRGLWRGDCLLQYPRRRALPTELKECLPPKGHCAPFLSRSRVGCCDELLVLGHLHVPQF